MSYRSNFLFADPTFFDGASRILDFGNTLSEYNYSESDVLADYRAIAQDWLAVGDDMEHALTEMFREAIQACPEDREKLAKQLKEWLPKDAHTVKAGSCVGELCHRRYQPIEHGS